MWYSRSCPTFFVFVVISVLPFYFSIHSVLPFILVLSDLFYSIVIRPSRSRILRVVYLSPSVTSRSKINILSFGISLANFKSIRCNIYLHCYAKKICNFIWCSIIYYESGVPVSDMIEYFVFMFKCKNYMIHYFKHQNVTDLLLKDCTNNKLFYVFFWFIKFCTIFKNTCFLKWVSIHRCIDRQNIDCKVRFVKIVKDSINGIK